MRHDRNEFIPHPRDIFAKFAFELLGGRAQRQIGFGPDQIDDRFGLSEVHFAV